MSAEFKQFNVGAPDEFSYSIEFVKDTSGDSYSVIGLVDEFNVWESLFTKAMQCQLQVADASGVIDQIALQPNDKIKIVLMKTSDLPKVEKEFVITGIAAGSRTINSQGKTYVISGLTEPAIKNKISTVNKAMQGTISSMVQTIAKDYLGIEDVDVEDTEGDKKNVVMPGYKPFKMLQWLSNHAISPEGGEDQSFYLFFENADGFKFKTVKKIIADANVHSYSVTQNDNRQQDGKDIWRITHYVHNKLGSHFSRLDNGMIQNEIVEFDHKRRTIVPRKINIRDQGEKIRNLGTAPILDTTNNLESLLQQESKYRAQTARSRIRSSEEAYGELNSYGRKHGALIMQKQMWNQLSFTLQFLGNPCLRAGDLIDVEENLELNSKTSKEMDRLLVGKFLVGNVRHVVGAGGNYLTVVDIFKDGHEVPYEPQS
jgi:hypothetical protein